MTQVLLIDDDPKLGQLLSRYFEQFGLSLSYATSPSDGYTVLASGGIELLILDVMLPEQDGFEVCREIRADKARYGDLPIIMLTARGDVTDRIVGLELGADDYLPKPFEPRELVVRVKTILRRASHGHDQSSANHLMAEGLNLDVARSRVSLEGCELDLTTLEFELLLLLMENPARVFHRDELTSRLRGIDADIYSRAIDTLVSRLRNKLDDNGKPARFIKTVWGRGYQFIGDVAREGQR
jgi:OmpR family response regulator RpaB